MSLVTVIAGCAGSTRISALYKGAPKYAQPRINIFPEPNSYKLDQPLADSLQTKLNQKIDSLFLKQHIAGITATMLIPQKGFWETNRGFISKRDNITVDDDSVFFWASVGKLITSTIVHQLIIEGKLSLNDKLSKWFPDIQNAEKITINQLLTHTNGIYSFNADPDLQGSNKVFTPEEFLEIAKKVKLVARLGKQQNYPIP